ncbi:hypothetical protein, partial [Acinetobacter pittii]|uniref:hypothetical protein n=1 Tax=Acinetobacter pittii TaxID=48296 RepID=UPI00355ADCB0
LGKTIFMSSESKAQQGIQQTVKHFKAFFISEKPIFLSKILILILIIEYQNSAHGFRYIYPSNLTGWTGYRNLYLLIASHLRSKVLVLCRVVHRYRHGAYRFLERKW